MKRRAAALLRRRTITLPFEERLKLGQAQRQACPRVGLADVAPARRREDPVAILERRNAGRVRALLPIKWGRMAVSPFGFFRGAAPIMIADLAAAPDSRLAVQLCGDAHLRNLGAFAAPDGQLVFDVNDFDESAPGPFEWDLKRLATSFVLAAREAGHPDELCGDIVLSLVRTYREAMRRFAGIPVLELFRHVLTRQGTDGAVADLLAKAERASPAVTLRKLTSAGSDGTRKFLEHPPLLTPVAPSQARKILASLKPYRDTITLDRRLVLEAYRPVAAAFKVVGIGSVGLRDFVIYGCGAGPDDPLFLQVKEMPASCYAAVLPEARGNGHQGQRVAQAQQRMQSVSDPLLGWTTIDGVDYLVRQLADHKASIDPAALRGSELEEYAVVCGEIFARTHARTGDPAVLTGYCGASDRLDKAIRKFALVYADRTAADHAALVAAIANGRLESWAV